MRWLMSANKFQKIWLLFFSNLKQDIRKSIYQTLGVNFSTNLKKYLWLPSIVGRNKHLAFKDLKERMKRKVEGWSARLLLMGEKEVQTKVVLQAIPLYTMSCFLLPSSLCKELDGVMARFWWEKKVGKKRLHWCSWDSLCASKLEGGIGLRDFSKFNILPHLGANPSFIWCSIWSLKALLTSSLRWRIGSGHAVSI